jgi:ferredoxin
MVAVALGAVAVDGLAVSSMRVQVNPIACTAHGLCAELLPEWIELDEWGYPIVDAQPVPHQLRSHARRAAAACPVRAIVIERT